MVFIDGFKINEKGYKTKGKDKLKTKTYTFSHYIMSSLHSEAT